LAKGPQMKYSPENIAAVEDRILEYQQALEATEAGPLKKHERLLTPCRICETTEPRRNCKVCLLANKDILSDPEDDDFLCFSPLRYEIRFLSNGSNDSRDFLHKRLAEMLDSVNKNLEKENTNDRD